MIRFLVLLILEGCVVKEHAMQLSASRHLEEGHKLRIVWDWICFCTLMVLSKVLGRGNDQKSEYSQEKTL
jgi:hypothetical protein